MINSNKQREVIVKKFIGTKILKAEPMTLGDYNKHRGWDIPEDEDPSKEGYLVEYPDGYQSWSPVEVFDEAYRRTDNMTFGLAIEAMKKGHKVARAGWNGNGMHLEVQLPSGHSKNTHPYLLITVPGCEEGVRKLPWQPAQVDIFADDWAII